MGLGDQIESVLNTYRRWRREAQTGPLGAFYRAGGQEVLYRDLPLQDSDLVIDVGAYRGDFAAGVLERYGCKLILLEPLPEMLVELRARFAKNRRVELIPAALGVSTGRAELTVAADSSSLVASATSQQATVEIEVMGADALWARLGGARIGCMKLNIEGAEYDLLEHLIERGRTQQVDSLLIQFHSVGPDAVSRRARIREALAKTHREVFSYDFVWELWRQEKP